MWPKMAVWHVHLPQKHMGSSSPVLRHGAWVALRLLPYIYIYIYIYIAGGGWLCGCPREHPLGFLFQVLTPPCGLWERLFRPIWPYVYRSPPSSRSNASSVGRHAPEGGHKGCESGSLRPFRGDMPCPPLVPPLVRSGRTSSGPLLPEGGGRMEPQT